MAWKRNILVVANVTATSEELLAALKERVAQEPATFTLIVPATAFGGGHAAAAQQVDDAVEHMRAAGLLVEGSPGDADPIIAVSEAWDAHALRRDHPLDPPDGRVEMATGRSSPASCEAHRRSGDACRVAASEARARDRPGGDEREVRSVNPACRTRGQNARTARNIDAPRPERLIATGGAGSPRARRRGFVGRLLVLSLGCFAAGMAFGSVDVVSASGGAGLATPLASTPYMGWNTYYGVGGVFDQGTIISVAKALTDRGLAGAGYRIVWLDYGWASGKRSRNGELIVDRSQWPRGLSWLTGWLHAHGLLAGIYTDAGASGCRREGVGSLDHYQQDADAFAAWGFDAVKVDFCGAGQEGLAPQPLYHQFAAALANNSSHRPMLLNVCNFWVPGQVNGKRPTFADSSYANALWAPEIAQSWRTDTDIGSTGDIQFTNVLRNLDHDAARPRAAGPGHWNDPDYLGPELGMTSAEAQAQMTMWAIVAAPLILGSDPRKLSPATIEMLENPQVIAIDQDPMGTQGTDIDEQGAGQVWVKPLLGGDRAVALLNRGATAIQITTSAGATGIAPAPGYRIENLWTHTTATTTGEITARVPPHAAALYRLTAS